MIGSIPVVRSPTASCGIPREPTRPCLGRESEITGLMSRNKAPGPTLLMPRPEHGSMPVNQIKILRRDPNAGQKKSPSPTVTNQKTMEERAQEYRRARERIFGKEAEDDKPSSPVGGAGPNMGQGERSGTNSPKGDFAFVPTQVRKSLATPGERPRQGGPGGQGNGRAPGGEGESRRIVRQPRGPGQGGGFGGRGAH